MTLDPATQEKVDKKRSERAPQNTRQARQRLRTMAVVFGFLFLCVGYRLIDLVPNEADAQELARRWSDEPVIERSDILDRNGRLIATDIKMPALILNPKLIIDPAGAAEKLVKILRGVDHASIEAKLRRDSGYALIRHKISPEEQTKILQTGIRGVSFRELPHRAYPGKNLASHLLGSVNIDNKGVAGIERGLDEELRSPSNEPIQLTVDLRVQQIARDALSRGFIKHKAIGGCAMVLDIQTGALVSLVSLPDFDPNRYGRFDEPHKLNRCTGAVYELGSLFKVVTTAMALETGKVDLYDWFDATKPLKVNRFKIRDHHAKKRSLSTPEVFIFSSNIGTAKMAMAAGGSDAQRPFLKSVGMFDPPVLPFPEVRHPIVPRKWIESTTATVAFGHTLAVSPLQLVNSVAAIAGDGTHIPARVRMDGPLPKRVRWIGQDTARDMRWLMWLNVAKGTGRRAGSPSYLVGGKTGTADKPRKGGGYHYDKVISSFVSVFPIEQPQYVVFAMLDEPVAHKSSGDARGGAVTAAPIVGEIIKKSGPVLAVMPSEPETEALFHRRLIEAKIWNPARGRQEKSFAALPLP